MCLKSFKSERILHGHKRQHLGKFIQSPESRVQLSIKILANKFVFQSFQNDNSNVQSVSTDFFENITFHFTHSVSTMAMKMAPHNSTICFEEYSPMDIFHLKVENSKYNNDRVSAAHNKILGITHKAFLIGTLL